MKIISSDTQRKIADWLTHELNNNLTEMLKLTDKASPEYNQYLGAQKQLKKTYDFLKSMKLPY